MSLDSMSFRFLHWLDPIFLTLCTLYIVAGAASVPFHGDESTQIYMGRDFYYQFVWGDLRYIAFNADPATHISPDFATEQELRLLNGTVIKYVFGWVASVSGLAFEQINTQWDWCCDWQYNVQQGHLPAPALLQRTRLISAAFLAGSVFVFFAIARQLGGRGVAYLATLYYVLHPAVLLNGRRAMMEGGLLFFALLALWAAVRLAAHWAKTPSPVDRGEGSLAASSFSLRALWAKFDQSAVPSRAHKTRGLGGEGYLFLFGIFGGLALATKHTNLFGLLALFGALGMVALYQRAGWRITAARLAALVGAGLLLLGVFYALNPAWWGDPFARAQWVLHKRTALLTIQTAALGSYPDLGAKLNGFFQQVLVGLPQYYEVAAWQDYIGGQIADYEASLWRGVSVGGSLIGGLMLGVLAWVGMVALWRNQHSAGGVRGVLLVYTLMLLLLTIGLTPLEWQRYYLPVFPLIGLYAALGVKALVTRHI
jgi:4-amino-4-deoxy-L-arabinose transferase-like glycosyltransferase